MKKILTTALVATTASIVCAGIVFAENNKGTVNASELNLRENPSTNSNALDVLYRGAKVNIITEEGDWYKVKYNNEEGYVSKQYVKIEEAQNTITQNTQANNTINNSTQNETEDNTVDNNYTNSANTVDNTTSNETTGSDSNLPVDVIQVKIADLKQEATMYVLPLINSTKIGKVDAETKVLIISINGSWSYIQTDTQNGWILTEKLDIQEPTETPTDTTPEPTSTQKPTETQSTPTPTVTPTPEPTTTQSEYPTTMYVNVEAVNVREQTNTNSTVVTSVGKNVPVTVESKEGEWYKVKTSDGNGYIKGEFLSKTKQ